MSNTVNLNSNNDYINKTAKKTSKSTGIYQLIFYYKVFFIYTEFDCEFHQKKKAESNIISVKLHSRKDRAHLLASYKPFFLFLQTQTIFRYFSRIEWKKLQTNFYLVVCFILSKQQFWSLIFGSNINSK